MMLPLYNDEICPEENEIRSLNLISDHCSGLYSPPNVGEKKADPRGSSSTCCSSAFTNNISSVEVVQAPDDSR